ncbi:LamG domain-containing protein [Paenibacillus cremeus]|uniref:LamG domain-containing protein n=2 Tax=Paenibacillus cremeus TaxID=2163881 RepID=A0A559K6N8_9BACL|nr:LamG domain-containing protein [Paenibacillus cremeus]
MSGSSLAFYVNGVQELTATDSTFSSGKAGLISIAGNESHFDDIQVADIVTASSYDNAVLADSPVGYWPISTSVTTDQTGHGMTGTYTGSPTATTLPNGEAAVAFNGVDQYMTIADNDYLEVTRTGIITIEAWMRPDVLEFPHAESSGYVHWMGKGTSGQHSWVARMYSYTNTENRPNRISGYSFNLSGGLGAGSYFQDTVTAGQWIHYTLVINTVNTDATYTTGYTKIFKNGVLRDQDKLSDYSIIPGNGTAPMRIGTRDLNSFFQGAVGKVAVYDYELTPAQLTAHYNAMTQ